MRAGFFPAGVFLLTIAPGVWGAAEPEFAPRPATASVRRDDPFDAAAAAAVGVSTATVARWRGKGFGKTEVLILGEMVRRSTWTFDALAAARVGGAPLKTLARQCGADEAAVFRAARDQRRRIERTLLPTGPAGR
ncbi:MAG TPA: hypothetical protein PKB12_03600 [Elusimicrobiota bacterium]|jgi:hypothetical protein|nr:hypothetical protein [Elusimicrobiota bacterium]HMX42782.1 hypothetical protein [Elusimicrobiota bacterium]HMZ26593.1 hypothetical protein [Elusimicrobiota bacterium]HNA60325.1 hypothetical protein [Elusimicrobiota bacterium]HNF58594.1 hypothetical protein [Elusimicrobiota bacterium]